MNNHPAEKRDFCFQMAESSLLERGQMKRKSNEQSEWMIIHLSKLLLGSPQVIPFKLNFQYRIFNTQ
jgi:hypothetical protein